MFLCNKRFITCNFLGQHDDARMNLAIALTAVRHGASVANHVEVLSLLKRKGRKQLSTLSTGVWSFRQRPFRYLRKSFRVRVGSVP